MWPDKDYKWLPREQTFSSMSTEREEEDPTADLQANVKGVESKVDMLAAAMVRIEHQLGQMGQSTQPLV